MKRKLIVAAVILASLYIGGVIGYNLKTPVEATNVAQTSNPPTVSELLKLVNAERAKYGVKPLKLDPRLNASAQMKANDEAQYGYFGHMRDGKFVGQEFINATGITCVVDSENLHWANPNILTAKETVEGWISSKPHHEAMINPDYDLTGFGIQGKQVVEHFCQTN